jgi:hypothetical protein
MEWTVSVLADPKVGNPGVTSLLLGAVASPAVRTSPMTPESEGGAPGWHLVHCGPGATVVDGEACVQPVVDGFRVLPGDVVHCRLSAFDGTLQLAVNDGRYVTVYTGLGLDLLPCVYALAGGVEVELGPPRPRLAQLRGPAFEALSLFVCSLMVMLGDRGGGRGGPRAGPGAGLVLGHGASRFTDRDIRQLGAFGRAGTPEVRTSMLSVVFNYIAEEEVAQRMVDNGQPMSVKGLFALLKTAGLLDNLGALTPKRCELRAAVLKEVLEASYSRSAQEREWAFDVLQSVCVSDPSMVANRVVLLDANVLGRLGVWMESDNVAEVMSAVKTVRAFVDLQKDIVERLVATKSSIMALFKASGSPRAACLAPRPTRPAAPPLSPCPPP